MKRKQKGTDNSLHKPIYAFKKLRSESRTRSEPDPRQSRIFVSVFFRFSAFRWRAEKCGV